MGNNNLWKYFAPIKKLSYASFLEDERIRMCLPNLDDSCELFGEFAKVDLNEDHRFYMEDFLLKSFDKFPDGDFRKFFTDC